MMKNYIEKMLNYASRLEGLGIDTDHISEDDVSLFAALHDLSITDLEFKRDWFIFQLELRGVDS